MSNYSGGGGGGRGAYKTRVCRFWQRGHCKQGDRCTYAHGQEELKGGGGGGGGGGRGGSRSGRGRRNNHYDSNKPKSVIEMPERPDIKFPNPDEGLSANEIEAKKRDEQARKDRQREWLKSFMRECDADPNIICPSETPAILR